MKHFFLYFGLVYIFYFEVVFEIRTVLGLNPRIGFSRKFLKIFFSPKVLECHNSARKLKKIEKKILPLQTAGGWTLKKFSACCGSGFKRFSDLFSVGLPILG